MSDATGSDITGETNGIPASAAVEAAKTIYGGDIPSNKLINATIESTYDALEERRREAALDQRGQLLAKDATKILENTKRFLQEKNSDEMIQQLFYHSKEASLEAKKKAGQMKVAAERSGQSLEQMQGQAEDLFYISKRVVLEVAKSSEFRSLLTETLAIVRKIFWKGLDTKGSEINSNVKRNKNVLPDYQNRYYNPDPEDLFIQKTAIVHPEVGVRSNGVNEEDKNRLLDQFALVLSRLSSKPEYHKAVNGILTLIDQLQVKRALLKNDPNVSGESVTEAQRKVWEDLKILIERWTGEGSVQPVLDNFRKFYKIVSNDPRAKSVFKNGSQMLRDTFQNPESINEQVNRDRYGMLIDQCRSLMNDQRYSAYWSDILEQFSDLLKSFREDESSQALGEAISSFAANVAKDSYGRVSLGAFQDSLSQMKSLFLPVILKQLEAVPIGRIQKSTPKMDYTIDNVVLSAYDVLPEMIKINFLTILNVDMKDLATDNAIAKLRLEIKNIRTHLRDVHFKFVRKQFPRVEDEGIVDLDVHGQGMSMLIEWEVSTNDKNPEEHLRFKTTRTEATVDQVAVNIKQAKHPVLDRVGTKLFNAKIKTRVEDETETYLQYFGRYVADGLNKALSSRTDSSKVNETPRSSSSNSQPGALSVN